MASPEFDWQANRKPTLTDNRGRTITLELDNLVPILQQKNGSVTWVNLSAVPALPGEPDFENSRPPDAPAGRGESDSDDTAAATAGPRCAVNASASPQRATDRYRPRT